MKEQTKDSLDKRVSYYESPACEIAIKLRQMGYETANFLGIRNTEPEKDNIGILKSRNIQKSFLGIKYTKKYRALHIGTLWFDEPQRKTKEDKKWRLDVYGKRNLPQLTDIVKNLSKPYKAKVQVELKEEYPKGETFLEEYNLLKDHKLWMGL